jgi:dTDP-glucose 4,6-dehydratase
MDWHKLSGTRILMTGGTGFVGSAMLDYFAQSDVDCELYVTTRNPIAQFSDRRVKRLDRERLKLPNSASYVVHLEPDTECDLMPILWATTRCHGRLLYASSGAVDVNHDCYANAKKQRETTLLKFSRLYRIVPIVARLWAFVGPHLSLDQGYAVGNFILDALRGGPIVVKGDGKAVRSYMYTTDLAEWMWTILLHGTANNIYNVGSEDAVTIGDLATEIAFKMNCPVIVLGDSSVPSTRYVPDTSATRNELGLSVKVSRSEALDRTIEWGRSENRQ